MISFILPHHALTPVQVPKAFSYLKRAVKGHHWYNEIHCPDPLYPRFVLPEVFSPGQADTALLVLQHALRVLIQRPQFDVDASLVRMLIELEVEDPIAQLFFWPDGNLQYGRWW